MKRKKNNLENDINDIDIKAETDDVFEENDKDKSEKSNTIDLEEKLEEEDLDNLGNGNKN